MKIWRMICVTFTILMFVSAATSAQTLDAQLDDLLFQVNGIFGHPSRTCQENWENGIIKARTLDLNAKFTEEWGERNCQAVADKIRGLRQMAEGGMPMAYNCTNPNHDGMFWWPVLKKSSPWYGAIKTPSHFKQWAYRYIELAEEAGSPCMYN